MDLGQIWEVSLLEEFLEGHAFDSFLVRDTQNASLSQGKMPFCLP